ncbi:hypothetical protein ABZV67_44045 [Streptomyces sp. NPDC005065]|uniref:hypothetical protein n=1 Tax=Streptomyces sp. NPDC005065 TaxID=3154461 RepID=UPI00339F6B58
MRTIRLANLNAYKITPATRGTSSWNARATAIQEIAPDILALQEVVVDENTTSRDSWEDEAAALIQDLAEQCGLTATVGAPTGSVCARGATTHCSMPRSSIANRTDGSKLSAPNRMPRTAAAC